MSESGRPVGRAEQKQRLADAATVQEQLRQRVNNERAGERLWEQRAELARSRGRADLAEQALARAAEHRERAGYLEAELIDQQSHVEELRGAIEQPSRSGVDPEQLMAALDVDPAEMQLGALARDAELDRDLGALKAKMGKGAGDT